MVFLPPCWELFPFPSSDGGLLIERVYCPGLDSAHRIFDDYGWPFADRVNCGYNIAKEKLKPLENEQEARKEPEMLTVATFAQWDANAKFTSSVFI